MGLTGKESFIRVAAVQWEPQICQKAHNLDKSVSLIHDAAKGGANLIVLPEMCNSGYAFESREEAFEQGESIPDGPTSQTWIKAARTIGVYLVAGMIEREENCLYNAAVLLGPDQTATVGRVSVPRPGRYASLPTHVPRWRTLRWRGHIRVLSAGSTCTTQEWRGSPAPRAPHPACPGSVQRIRR